jgi:hypothetical protein
MRRLRPVSQGGGLMGRFRREEGGAVLPIAIAVLLIVVMVTGVAVAYSVRSVDRSNYDRYSARALAAADAGLDVAQYRVNKSIAGTKIGSVIGLVNDLLWQLDGCTSINVSAAQLIRVGVNTNAGWCAVGGWEAVDGEGGLIDPTSPKCQPHTSAAYRLFMRLRVGADVVGDGQSVINDDILIWDVISAGCSNGRTAVVRGELKMSLPAAVKPGKLLKLFSLEDYKQCGGLAFDPAQPAATCD